MKTISGAVFFMIVGLSNAWADEFSIRLKQGPGQDVTRTQCSACHSPDYILMNSPFLDAKGWTGEVTKMITVFGADINDADAKTIADYLASNYGG